MRLLDRDETVVLVTGTAGTAGERDRPLAFSLRDAIDARGNGHPYRRAVVTADTDYLDRPALHANPTIAIGGPGVNAVAQQFAAGLPMVWQEEERVFVQADFDAEPKRVTLWGMDASATASAVDTFINHGFLDLLLERIWRIRPETVA